MTVFIIVLAYVAYVASGVVGAIVAWTRKRDFTWKEADLLPFAFVIGPLMGLVVWSVYHDPQRVLFKKRGKK